MPFQNTYVPLIHLVVAAVASLAKISAAHAYHVVTGVAYSLGAATFFLMAMRLGPSRGASFVAALTYSLFSPSALLMPSVATDIGGWFNCRRLQALVVYGEGPHVTSLAILPLAILALQECAQRRTGRSFALAALAIRGGRSADPELLPRAGAHRAATRRPGHQVRALQRAMAGRPPARAARLCNRYGRLLPYVVRPAGTRN